MMKLGVKTNDELMGRSDGEEGVAFGSGLTVPRGCRCTESGQQGSP